MIGERYKSVLLLGAPGTGKGTQGKLLGCIPGFFHHSSGEIFRAINPRSEIGKIFHQYSTRGELVPDDVTIRIWRENIQANEALSRYRPDRDLLVLDGIPRNVTQATLMDDHVDVLLVLHLTCDDEGELIRRLKGRAAKEGRLDDTKEDVIRRRLEVYREQTRPLLDHYPPSVIAPVNAVGSPAVVLQHVLEAVAPIQSGQMANALS